ncbi:MAG: ParB N-terminal domain-containing protein [Thermotogae bacterium]|nr:ParB N-terminal domain-containing protein [Thermotogota bacterium]
MFWCHVREVQPSQTYLSRKLLERAILTVKGGILRPFPVRRMDGRIVLLDGHHTAFALVRAGFAYIPCRYDTDPVDMEMYRWAVGWALREGITSIPALARRIVSHEDFRRLWVGACEDYKRRLR